MANLLQIGFLFITLPVASFGVLVNWFSAYLPPFIISSYKYGKCSYKGSVKFSLKVPKRWYRHFYIFSSILSLLAFSVMCSIYLGASERIPHFIKYMINRLRFLGMNTGTVEAGPSLLAMALFMVQCFKRLYETYFVNVFSDAKMDLIHYIMAFYHYFGTVLALFCEAPGILNSDEKYSFSLSDLKIWHIVFAVLFLWATINQFQCAKILGDLRKNKKGQIVTKKYNIPYGGYFKYVSNPNQFFEVVMYFCLWLILFGNETWPFVLVFVIINQIETSLLSHWWYQETFKEYPKERKAIIPFLL